MTVLEARLVRGKLYRPAKLGPDGPLEGPYRSREIVAGCGKRDKHGRQTCTGTFGALDTWRGPTKIALWGAFRYDSARRTFRSTNHARKASNRGSTPGLRRSVVQMPYLTRGAAEDRQRLGVRWQDYRDYGPMGERLTGNAVTLPVEVECPRCGVRQTIPARLGEEAQAFHAED